MVHYLAANIRSPLTFVLPEPPLIMVTRIPLSDVNTGPETQAAFGF